MVFRPFLGLVEGFMTYRCEFCYKVKEFRIRNTGWVKVGSYYNSAKEALSYCYDLTGRDSDIIDWRVQDELDQTIFQRNRFIPEQTKI
jgi:hypothetical protein